MEKAPHIRLLLMELIISPREGMRGIEQVEQYVIDEN